jgi:hypothetical protein
MTRVDAILAELSARHRNHDPRFLALVRPMVAQIVDPGMPEGERVRLLELVAETFERDVQVRRDCAAAKAAWGKLFATLQKLLGMN